jgi:hypothetical protein
MGILEALRNRVALEADDITGEVEKATKELTDDTDNTKDKNKKKTTRKKPTVKKNTKKDNPENDPDDITNTDDLLGTNNIQNNNQDNTEEEDNDTNTNEDDNNDDNPLSNDPNVDDANIEEDNNPDDEPTNDEDNTEEDQNLDDNNLDNPDDNMDDDNNIEEEDEEDTPEYYDKNKLKENMIYFYNIIMSNISSIMELQGKFNDPNGIDTCNKVLAILEECGKILYDDLTKKMKTASYEDLVKDYITTKRVFDICIEMLSKHFGNKSDLIKLKRNYRRQ